MAQDAEVSRLAAALNPESSTAAREPEQCESPPASAPPPTQSEPSANEAISPDHPFRGRMPSIVALRAPDMEGPGTEDCSSQ